MSTAIHCYQCSSSQDPKGQDNCGAYETFDTERNSPVECSSGESHMPGSFCVKVTKQGPIGFVWDGRWRQVTRRCASISNSGVTGVCNWGVDYNGVYWEECYCSSDACNSASDLRAFSILVYSMIFFTISFLSKWTRSD
ncbi:uncharacterized protein LOC125500761 isoform X2 [Athalia rosae]|uniref:uncharacterized protein LOC125500761 isoform X2 n=1 Tax=Athalia rosae TaxID=37344 RepID=UPI002033A028|nr:uncharacterized protein LOC125500761 isoform X2 [Athalia rosae]